jgi:hypothetical protein
VDDPGRVAHDDVADAGLTQDLGDRDAGRAGADDGDREVFGVAVLEPQRVGERGEDDDGGAVLVVVEDRDVQERLEAVLDVEAAGRGDVLEVDPAEGRRDGRDGGHDRVGVLGAQADRDGVDAGELAEEGGFALHDGERGGGADVAEAEDGGAVGDDGDHVRAPGVRPGQGLVGGDGLAHAGHARRVGDREVLAGLERDGGDGAQFAAPVGQEDRVLQIDHGMSWHRKPHCFDDDRRLCERGTDGPS